MYYFVGFLSNLIENTIEFLKNTFGIHQLNIYSTLKHINTILEYIVDNYLALNIFYFGIYGEIYKRFMLS